jgi:hypothetical protein
LSTVVADGTRHVDEPLLTEFEVQRKLFGNLRPGLRSVAGGRRD